MKISEQLRQEHADWRSGNVLIEAADLIDRLGAERQKHLETIARLKAQRDAKRALLDECERAFLFILQEDCECDECSKACDMLAKLRAQERD